VRQREDCRHDSKDPGTYKQDATSAQQPSEIYGEGTDEDKRGIEGASYPRPIIEADPNATFEVGQAEREQPTSQRYDSCS
jgi:hypothetical protein